MFSLHRPKLRNFWVLLALHIVLFCAFLSVFLGPKDDDPIRTSFSHFKVTTTPSSNPQSPQTSSETGTGKEPQKPVETEKLPENHQTSPGTGTTEEPQKPTEKPPETKNPKNPSTTTSPDAPQYHSPLPFSVYNSRTAYTPKTSTFDFLSMKQAKVTIVELQGTSSFLVKGGVIPIRSVNPLFMCALNTTKLCQSLYPADVIDLLYSFSPIYGWGPQDRSKALYANHFNFRDYMLSIGVPVVVLEAIYPGQQFLATSPGKEPWEIQLKVEDSFYYRENFLNVAARKTPKWEYLLWIDGHQIFLNTYWWEESIRKLEKYGTVQLFQYLYYMRRNRNTTDMNVNYAGIQYGRYLATPFFAYPDSKRGLWAGNAWGIRREVYNEIGYILDTCVCGWCDSAYNIPTFGEFEDWALFLFPKYKAQLMPWLENAGRVFKKYGYGPAIVRGNMVHFDHERFSKAEIERAQKAIGKGGYNMTTDLYRDENFTLHTYEGSPMATLFTKRKWTN